MAYNLKQSRDSTLVSLNSLWIFIEIIILTFKAPITAAAYDIFCDNFPNFQKEIRYFKTLAVVRPTGVYLLDFFFFGIQFYLLLIPYLCFISFLYIDLYVLGDDALIS